MSYGLCKILKGKQIIYQKKENRKQTMLLDSTFLCRQKITHRQVLTHPKSSQFKPHIGKTKHDSVAPIASLDSRLKKLMH